LVGLGIKSLCPKAAYKKEKVKQRPLQGCPDNIFIGCGVVREKKFWVTEEPNPNINP